MLHQELQCVKLDKQMPWQINTLCLLASNSGGTPAFLLLEEKWTIFKHEVSSLLRT